MAGAGGVAICVCVCVAEAAEVEAGPRVWTWAREAALSSGCRCLWARGFPDIANAGADNARRACSGSSFGRWDTETEGGKQRGGKRKREAGRERRKGRGESKIKCRLEANNQHHSCFGGLVRR